MNFSKHEEHLRYEHCIYGNSEVIVARFDEAPESSLRHLEKTVVNPLLVQIRKRVPKNKLKLCHVTMTVYSTSTMFDCSSFNSTGSALRLLIQSKLCRVGDWNVIAKDNCDDFGIEFHVRVLGDI